MSNSSLVSYTKLSPNCTKPRRSKIDTLTIHCMAGNLSVETCGAGFAKSSRQASSNYGIGSDGRIALYVDEANRSWCSGNPANDHRAVTIEVANTKAADPWPVSDKAYESLINLCADICKRNGIKKLVWSTNKNDRINHKNGCNMTVHRDFQNKACPGDYLYERHGDIAARVNAILSGTSAAKEEEDIVDQDKFNEMAEIWVQQLAAKDATWEAAAMAWAQQNGLMSGDDQGRLMSKKFLTRGELATVLQRYDSK